MRSEQKWKLGEFRNDVLKWVSSDGNRLKIVKKRQISIQQVKIHNHGSNQQTLDWFRHFLRRNLEAQRQRKQEDFEDSLERFLKGIS